MNKEHQDNVRWLRRHRRLETCEHLLAKLFYAHLRGENVTFKRIMCSASSLTKRWNKLPTTGVYWS